MGMLKNFFPRRGPSDPWWYPLWLVWTGPTRLYARAISRERARREVRLSEHNRIEQVLTRIGGEVHMWVDCDAAPEARTLTPSERQVYRAAYRDFYEIASRYSRANRLQLHVHHYKGLDA